MGRTATHTTDGFLDAAVSLFVQGGSRAVTMVSVARAVGAPSGSIYHRFSDRPALPYSVWVRAVRAFDEAYRLQLGKSPTPAHAVGSAVWVVDWCRAQAETASVLHAGQQAFSPSQWATADVDALASYERGRERRLGALVRGVAAAADQPRDEVAFAMFDMPLAVVRRYLPGPVPTAATNLVRRLASAILLRGS
jgi:AcrR family transcriptional regulator